jgi:sugar phosphate isomerase/epimerase
VQHDLSRFAINQITTPKWSMAEAIEGYSRRGISGIAVWRKYLDAYGVQRTARHLSDAGMWVASLCTTSWMNQPDAAGFRAAVEENIRLVEAAAAIGAPCVVVVTGGLPSGERDVVGFRARIMSALEELAPHARASGVKLGIEPLHPMYAGDRSVVNTCAQANAIIGKLGDEASGLVADLYHCWWDPQFEAELVRAGPDRILTFHLCDWLVPTRSFFDRGMPGDGVIDLARHREVLDLIGYKGPFELELFSDLDWWERDPEETVRIAIERCGPLVGSLIEDT